MSLHAQTWAYDCDGLAPPEKAVLVALAYYADYDDEAWPSVPTLMRMTAWSERSVWRSLANLEKAGRIIHQKTFRPNGSKSSNLYKLVGVPRPSHRAEGAPATLAPAHLPARQEGSATLAPPDLRSDLRSSELKDFDPFSNAHSNGHSNSNGYKKKKTNLRWPEGFKLNEQMRAFALKMGVSDPDFEFERFHAWADEGAWAKADWAAAWRTRCMNYKQFNKNGNGRRYDGRSRAQEEWDRKIEETTANAEREKRQGNTVKADDSTRRGRGEELPGRNHHQARAGNAGLAQS